MPRLADLHHVNVQVTWIPNDSSASQATATADTVGAVDLASGRVTPIHGHEQWTFARTGGAWRITSFTYNLCSPSGS